MRFVHTFKQKSKIALLLFGVMICIILIRILEDKSIKEMNKNFISMYHDRLIPATDLFYIAENLYAKHHLIEGLDENQSTIERVELIKKLGIHDANIQNIISKYEKTFLTPLEKIKLDELKVQLKENSNLENRLLQGEKSINKEEFLQKTTVSFRSIASNLTELTKIQHHVGEELIKNSSSLLTGSNLYSSIQFGLAIIIGILIVSIISTSNAGKITTEKFNLN